MRIQKKLVPFRIPVSYLDKLKMRISADSLTFQKLMEALMTLYLENDPYITEKIKKISKKKNNKLRRYNQFDDLERDYLFKKIEGMNNPLNEIEDIIDEIEEDKK